MVDSVNVVEIQDEVRMNRTPLAIPAYHENAAAIVSSFNLFRFELHHNFISIFRESEAGLSCAVTLIPSFFQDK